MKEYFVRYIINENQAERDLARGYSFSDYVLFSSPEEVAEHFGLEDGEYEVADYGDNPAYYFSRNIIAIAPDDPDGSRWGIMLNGLCGFGPFETIDEAEEFVPRGRGDYALGVYEYAAIFEGHETADHRCYEGTTFRPSSIVKIIKS